MEADARYDQADGGRGEDEGDGSICNRIRCGRSGSGGDSSSKEGNRGHNSRRSSGSGIDRMCSSGSSRNGGGRGSKKNHWMKGEPSRGEQQQQRKERNWPKEETG